MTFDDIEDSCPIVPVAEEAGEAFKAAGYEVKYFHGNPIVRHPATFAAKHALIELVSALGYGLDVVEEGAFIMPRGAALPLVRLRR